MSRGLPEVFTSEKEQLTRHIYQLLPFALELIFFFLLLLFGITSLGTSFVTVHKTIRFDWFVLGLVNLELLLVH